jgi:hypothetical protein
MINYDKLMAHKPTIYDQFTNSLGQVIKFAEHPIHGDEADIIAICDELQLAEYTGFWELDDMLADHKEYEPKFIDGKLFIGNFQH